MNTGLKQKGGTKRTQEDHQSGTYWFSTSDEHIGAMERISKGFFLKGHVPSPTKASLKFCVPGAYPRILATVTGCESVTTKKKVSKQFRAVHDESFRHSNDESYQRTVRTCRDSCLPPQTKDQSAGFSMQRMRDTLYLLPRIARENSVCNVGRNFCGTSEET